MHGTHAQPAAAAGVRGMEVMFTYDARFVVNQQDAPMGLTGLHDARCTGAMAYAGKMQSCKELLGRCWG